MKHEDELKINGSGLFFFKSDLSPEEQLEVLNWYNRLSEKNKRYIRLLLDEIRQESEFFAQGD